MRALIRRISFAEVKVDSKIVGTIEKGLLVYLGIHRDDDETDVDWIIKKILGIRIFEDKNGKMNLKIPEDGGILLVSQFTLCGKLKKGYRPSFNCAANSQDGQIFYNLTLNKLKHDFKRGGRSRDFWS